MFFFCLGIGIGIVGFVILGLKQDQDGDYKWGLRGRQILALVVIGIFTLIGSLRSVKTGFTGIVTTFGRVEGYTLEAGLHTVMPWQKVIQMDNRTQKVTLQMSCFSSDIQEVQVSYTVNFQIDKQNAQKIYSTIGVNYFDTIVQPKVYEALKGVFAKYTAETLVENRGRLSQEIEEVLTSDLSRYDIVLTATSIEDIDFTDVFTQAVEAKQVAEQNKLTAKTQQEQATIEAEAEAERQVIKANADAQSAIVAANADAEVAKIQADSAEYQGQKDAAIMSNLGKQLSDYPNLIKYYYWTTWNGELPETMLSDGTDVLVGIDN